MSDDELARLRCQARLPAHARATRGPAIATPRERAALREGTYENLSARDGEPIAMRDAIDRGRVRVRLHGKKLQGMFAFIRTRTGTGRRADRNWLLIKMTDESADARRRPTSTEPHSVRSGRTLDDVRKAAGLATPPVGKRRHGAVAGTR